MQMAGHGVEHLVLPEGSGHLAGKVEQGLRLPRLFGRPVDAEPQPRGKLTRRQGHGNENGERQDFVRSGNRQPTRRLDEKEIVGEKG